MHKLTLPQADLEYEEMGKSFFNMFFSDSIFQLKKATIINPTNIKAQIELTEAFFRLEKVNKGLDSLKKALSLNPEADELHILLITELKERDYLDDLEPFSKEILNMIIDPESILVFYFASAEALARCDMNAQAVLVYRKAMKNIPRMRFDHHYHYGLA